MKRILIVQYSQSGQLTDVMRHLTAPLLADPAIEVTVETLRPCSAYPFPWPILRFFDTFPEAVHLDPPELEPLAIDCERRFDLVILGYQVWFLSPSLPVTAFLKSKAAARLLREVPVVTVVACRDMWLMAQEQVKGLLAACGARLVGHVALVDEAGSLGSFLATPVWVMTGKKGPHLGGWIPRAGVSEQEMRESRRFGERMRDALQHARRIDEQLLQGLGAVVVKDRLIFSEKAIRRGLRLWGSLLRAAGPQGAPQRKPLVLIYLVWLVLMILIVVPLGMLLKSAMTPFMRHRIAAQKAYYGAPSGSRKLAKPIQ